MNLPKISKSFQKPINLAYNPDLLEKWKYAIENSGIPIEEKELQMQLAYEMEMYLTWLNGHQVAIIYDKRLEEEKSDRISYVGYLSFITLKHKLNYEQKRFIEAGMMK